MPHYKITGIPVNPGDPLPLRPDVNEWYAKRNDPHIKKQIDLFLLGLRQLQQMDPLDRLSFFQIAGIHGLPNVPWDEKIPTNVKPLQPSQGYCPHNSFLFPVWHRVYMTLYEQRIYECMREIADQYGERERAKYVKAATTWRLPYWDWALTSSVPELVGLPKVEVVGPCGREEFPNPLYQYVLPNGNVFGSLGIEFKTPKGSDQGQPFNISRATSRWTRGFPLPREKGKSYTPPTDAEMEAWHQGYIDNAKVKTAIESGEDLPDGVHTIKEMVWRILVTIKNWYRFASTRNGEWNKVSLEGVHNILHGYIGGVGNMSLVPIAAFDPIFLLHHCFIDKLFAQWQYLHPNKFYDRDTDDDGNFANIPGNINAETQLHPFRDGHGKLYTPNKTRKWESFGYGYKLDSRKEIDDKYGEVRRLVLKPESKDFVNYINQDGSQQVQHYDYIVNIRYSRYDLDDGEPYYIHVFLGDSNEVAQLDYKEPLLAWLTAPQRVGSIYTFSNKSEICSNCKGQQENKELCTEQIPLTHRLPALFKDAKRKAQLPTLSIKEASRGSLGNLLRKNLANLEPSDTLTPTTQIFLFHYYLFWTATRLDGTPIPPGALPSLAVSLSVGRISHEISLDTTADKPTSESEVLLDLPTAPPHVDEPTGWVPFTGEEETAWFTPYRADLSEDLQKKIKDLDLQYQPHRQQHVHR